MQSEQTITTTIQTTDGYAYEILNSLDEIKEMMFDNFIKADTFICLRFTDGKKLYIKKQNIVAFYESE